jgi:hypothetical protein
MKAVDSIRLKFGEGAVYTGRTACPRLQQLFYE